MRSPRRKAPSTTLASTMSGTRARPARVSMARALVSSRVSVSHPARSRASCAWRGVPRQHWAITGAGTGRYNAAEQQGAMAGPHPPLAVFGSDQRPGSVGDPGHAVRRAAGGWGDPGGPLVGFGDLVRRERAVLGLVLANPIQAFADDEFLPCGLGDPGAVGHPGVLRGGGDRGVELRGDGYGALLADGHDTAVAQRYDNLATAMAVGVGVAGPVRRGPSCGQLDDRGRGGCG